MKLLKSLYAYLFQAIFLAPWYAYVVFIVFISLVFGWLISQNAKTSPVGSGLIGLGVVELLVLICAIIGGLLLWRRADKHSFIIAMHILPSLLLVWFVWQSFANYSFYIRQETTKRDNLIIDNELTTRNATPLFDTSVPESWIKSDETILQEARKTVTDNILQALWAIALVIIPLIVIRALAGKKRYTEQASSSP